MTGVVTEANADTVTVKMDEHFPGAEEWDNEVVWTDADREHALDYLEPVGEADAERQRTEMLYRQDARP